MKQYTRVYRNSNGEVTHTHTQTTPIEFEPVESDVIIDSSDFIIEDIDETEEDAAAEAAMSAKTKEEFTFHKKRYQAIRSERFVKAKNITEGVDASKDEIHVKPSASNKVKEGKRVRELSAEEKELTVMGKNNNPNISVRGLK